MNYKYKKGDLVVWKEDIYAGEPDPVEKLMLILEVLPYRATPEGEKTRCFYTYRYLETGRQDSFNSESYEFSTLHLSSQVEQQ